MHAMIISMYDRFVQVVAEGRKIPGDRVRELGEGQVWTGREALANGLVDELGSLQDAENYIRNKLGGWVEFTGFTAGNPDDSEGLFGSLSQVVMTYAAGTDSAVLSASLKPYVRAASELLSIGSGPQRKSLQPVTGCRTVLRSQSGFPAVKPVNSTQPPTYSADIIFLRPLESSPSSSTRPLARACLPRSRPALRLIPGPDRRGVSGPSATT